VILYPDMGRDRYHANETFIFAAPISLHEWEQANAMATRLKSQTPGGLRYLTIRDNMDVDGGASVYAMRNEGINEVCILLREDHTDDECLDAAAWIRTVIQWTGLIYAVGSTVCRTARQDLNSASGADQSQVVMCELFSNDYEGEDDEP
jgi:hypothetical protein